MLIGSHVSPQDPLAAAQADGADVVQIFLGNPQSWMAPKLRDDAYVHSPYLIDVASANNRARIPSRKVLRQTCEDAAGSGRGRHANLGAGEIGTQLLVAAVRAADAPVICETAADGRKDHIAFLRERTGS